MENFRVDRETGNVYEREGHSFIFIGKLNGKTEEEFFDELFNEADSDD